MQSVNGFDHELSTQRILVDIDCQIHPPFFARGDVEDLALRIAQRTYMGESCRTKASLARVTQDLGEEVYAAKTLTASGRYVRLPKANL